MNRVKSFQSTGVAPLGKLYAGDLNAIQDAAAAQADFTQTIDLAVLRVGASDLQLIRYGAGLGSIASEARLSGSMRVDGIFRPIGGLILPAFSTIARNAIPAGMAPFGLKIYNTDTAREEFNAGTDGARNWQPTSGGGGTLRDVLANLPAAATMPGGMFYATDQDSFRHSNGTAWLRVGPIHAGDLIPTLNSVADPGRLILSGQSWASIGTTGVNADLYAKWSTAFPTNLPDLRGRALIALGTHAEVNAIMANDALPVNSRTPIHNASFSLNAQVTGYDNETFTGNLAEGAGSLVGTHPMPVTGTIGPAGSRPTDTIAYFVGNYEVKL